MLGLALVINNGMVLQNINDANKERLKCYNPNTIKGIIEGRISTKKYIEKNNGGKTNKWDLRTA